MNFSAGSVRNLSYALLTVMMPFTIVAQDGASKIRLMTMPND